MAGPELKPQTYLEVGVRRGFSMAMVAARAPSARIFGFDMWIRNYNGKNPGPRFVQREMRKAGYRGTVSFVSGDSHETLPAFFNGGARIEDARGLCARLMTKPARAPRRPETFELILVDGDHTLLGGYRDLIDVMPHCKVGGVVAFDDIAPGLPMADPDALKRTAGPDPYGWGSLMGVWRAVEKEFANFRFFAYDTPPPGIGIAVRLS